MFVIKLLVCWYLCPLLLNLLWIFTGRRIRLFWMLVFWILCKSYKPEEVSILNEVNCKKLEIIFLFTSERILTSSGSHPHSPNAAEQVGTLAYTPLRRQKSPGAQRLHTALSHPILHTVHKFVKPRCPRVWMPCCSRLYVPWTLWFQQFNVWCALCFTMFSIQHVSWAKWWDFRQLGCLTNSHQ